MKTWHFERLVHAVWLCSGVALQHGELIDRALLTGDPEALWKFAGIVLFVLGMLAFGGVASTGERQRERSQSLMESSQVWELGQKPVAGRYLRWGKVLVALSALQGQAVLSVFSMVWDLLIYPCWRRYWRRVHPLTSWNQEEHL